MSDSTYIGVDLKLTGVFNAPGQTVFIAGHFEGEMTAVQLKSLRMQFLKVCSGQRKWSLLVASTECWRRTI